MKKMVVSNQKGGVGKSAVICQYAHFLHSLGLRVVVIDMDHQCNTSKALKTGGKAVAKVSAYAVLTEADQTIENPESFMLVEGDAKLTSIEKNGNLHNSYGVNYSKFLENIDSSFDICLIDTNPNPDFRQVASLAFSDFVLSPIQLNQEAVDGIGALLKQLKLIYKLNPKLKFIGVLPNLVEQTPFQKENLAAIQQYYSKLLISIDADNYASIKKNTAIAESQAQGIAVNKLGKTSGYTAWAELKPIFETLNKVMGL